MTFLFTRVCTTCEKTFTQSCGLKIHGKTHTGEKSFACTTCEKTFAQSCGLKIYGRNSCVCLYMTLQDVLIDKGSFTYHCRKMAVLGKKFELMATISSNKHQNEIFLQSFALRTISKPCYQREACRTFLHLKNCRTG